MGSNSNPQDPKDKVSCVGSICNYRIISNSEDPGIEFHHHPRNAINNFSLNYRINPTCIFIF